MGEIEIAQKALKAVGANFSLGTNGWCLGPGDNASFFDKARFSLSLSLSLSLPPSLSHKRNFFLNSSR